MKKTYRVSGYGIFAILSLIASNIVPWVLIATAPLVLAIADWPLVCYVYFINYIRKASGKKVQSAVLIDDDKVTLQYLKRVVESMGFRVYTYENPYTALRDLNNVDFDFLVVDQVMPELKGEDFLLKLDSQIKRRKKPDVIFFTGFPGDVHIKSRNLNHLRLRGILSKNLLEYGNIRKAFNRSLQVAT
jgi:CheY-like chemotaxis protein